MLLHIKQMENSNKSADSKTNCCCFSTDKFNSGSDALVVSSAPTLAFVGVEVRAGGSNNSHCMPI